MRLIFRCTDSEGNLIEVATSEWESKGVEPSAIPKMWEFIAALGLTPVKAGKSSHKELVKFDGKHCPKCQSEMWDNRERNKTNGTKGPDFRCKNAECSGATTGKDGKKWPFSLWPGTYEVLETAPVNGNGNGRG